MALEMTKLWWESVPAVTVLLLNPLWVTVSDLQIQSLSVPRQLSPLEQEHVRKACQWAIIRDIHKPQRSPAYWTHPYVPAPIPPS